MGVFSNKIERDLLKAGYHIYSWRHACLYAHHGSNLLGLCCFRENNCEDFAKYCKTGLLVTLSVGSSGQAASFWAATTAIISSPLCFLTASFSGLAVVGCGMYCVGRLASDIGVRRDVSKVPVDRLVATFETVKKD